MPGTAVFLIVFAYQDDNAGQDKAPSSCSEPRGNRAGKSQPVKKSIPRLRQGLCPFQIGTKDERKFYYITLLRDPVSRYLSEWRHVQRGATWKTSLHMCDGRTPTPEELPPCYEGTDWSGCTLQQFMECPYNLANNRQVRMLADLSLVGCYNMSFIPEKKRAQILLESAKKNLRDMAFFGLTEFQRKTQYLFERTFHLKFIRPFVQYNSTRAAGVDLDNDTIQRIEELNELDVQLYDYARDLFQQRYMYKRQLERREQRLKNLRRSTGSIGSPMSRDDPVEGRKKSSISSRCCRQQAAEGHHSNSSLDNSHKPDSYNFCPSWK
ncbi:heparan-sulfate 6-O-sulfotransferase 1-A [Clarias magur]|uniref:Heparan-sulfate 6-O-sulfotransferase n=1 Tax=Clarias magur TaxID=1594786 RepID=A0A8J4UC12_CLAMG|nr:heparan-sulfate 6-O-sulfotransferase 1-A [Clarias magur]